jgi:hypothetical protein
MSKTWWIILLIVALAAGGAFAYYYANYRGINNVRPCPAAPCQIPNMEQILGSLKETWPQLEQGPLKHEAESGHWFLNEVQFINEDTLIAWYEDGLNDEFAVLVHDNGNFTVATTFTGYDALLEARSTYGSPLRVYKHTIFSYDNNTGLFNKIATSSVFGPGISEDLTMTVKIALLNPDQTLKNQITPGDISGCDHVRLEDVVIERTPAPLTAALNALLAKEGGWSWDDKLYNYIGLGNLQLESVDIVDGVARIYLTGTLPPLGGVCDEPRMLIQITQTAKQFPTVQGVELYVNGQLQG